MDVYLVTASTGPSHQIKKSVVKATLDEEIAKKCVIDESAKERDIRRGNNENVYYHYERMELLE